MCWNVATLDTSAPQKKHWTLTEAAFNKLLQSLDDDRQRAAERYEQLHRRLEKFFEIHSGTAAEELADETINRVTRKLEEGIEIQNIGSYCIGIARMLVKENLKEQNKRSELGDVPSSAAAELKSNESEKQLECLDGCLAELPFETRLLIMKYYELRKQAKIDHRKGLAEELGIPLNALRIRVHRIRVQLEECVIHCMRTSERT
jgi:DNA-directed RNA polymerase specialized sigma24 family protein